MWAAPLVPAVDATTHHRGALGAAGLLLLVPLAARRSAPLAACALVMAGAVLADAVGPSPEGLSEVFGLLVASYSVACCEPRARALAGLALAGLAVLARRRLPRRRAPADRGRAMTIRVLVADDQEPFRAGPRLVLRPPADVELVGQAGGGEQALALAARVRPDVVVMDLRMPVLDGIEATRRLAARGPEGPRVLALTTFGDDEHVYAALRAGAGGFLLEDTPPEELVAALRVVARGTRCSGRVHAVVWAYETGLVQPRGAARRAAASRIRGPHVAPRSSRRSRGRSPRHPVGAGSRLETRAVGRLSA